MTNQLRIFVGFLIVSVIHYPWRIGEKLLKKQFPAKGHYYMMRAFQVFGSSFPVSLRYPNPLTGDDRTIALNLDLRENSQLWYFREKGRYELDWIKLISLAMNDADTFIDVGANIGVFALTIGQAFPDRKVVAIEPLPEIFAKLEANIWLNRLSNVKAIKAAATETKGPLSFFVNPLNDGGGTLLDTEEYRTGDVRMNADAYQKSHPKFAPVIEVDGLPLDEIMTDKCVLKIDVEGAEVSAIMSGLAAIDKQLMDLAVVEVTRDTIDEVISILDGAGFDSFIQGQRSPITGVSQFHRRLGNIFCLRRNSALYNSILDQAIPVVHVEA